MTVTNEGPDSSEASEVLAELPPGLAALPSKEDGASCTVEDEVTISCSVGTLEVHEFVEMEVLARVEESLADTLESDTNNELHSPTSEQASTAIGLSARSLVNLFRAYVRSFRYDPSLANNLAKFRNHYCPKAIFYSARGSGEAGAVRFGLGRPGYALYKQLKRNRGLRGFNLVPIATRYPAVKVGWHSPGTYLPSVRAGVRRGSQDLRNFASWCSSRKTRVLLVGYSQGAHVIRNVLADVAGNRVIRRMVKGVRLFGDPLFRPEELPGPNNLGRFRASRHGILRGRIRAKSFASVWRGRIMSWCNRNDWVCQTIGVPWRHKYDSQAREPWFVRRAFNALA